MKSLTPIAMILVFLLLLGGYLGAYLGMGTRHEWPSVLQPKYTEVERVYRFESAGRLFAPAAWVESKLLGVNVVAKYYEHISPRPLP